MEPNSSLKKADSKLATLIHQAAKDNDISFIKKQVEKGLSVLTQDKHKKLPIELASDYKFFDTTLYLYGASVDELEKNTWPSADARKSFAKRVKKSLETCANYYLETYNDEQIHFKIGMHLLSSKKYFTAFRAFSKISHSHASFPSACLQMSLLFFNDHLTLDINNNVILKKKQKKDSSHEKNLPEELRDFDSDYNIQIEMSLHYLLLSPIKNEPIKHQLNKVIKTYFYNENYIKHIANNMNSVQKLYVNLRKERMAHSKLVQRHQHELIELKTKQQSLMEASKKLPQKGHFILLNAELIEPSVSSTHKMKKTNPSKKKGKCCIL